MATKDSGILSKMHKAAKYFDYLPKDKENRFHRYKYVSEAMIKEKAHKMLEEVGLVFSFSINNIDIRHINDKVLYTIEVEYKFIDVETKEEFSGRCAGSGVDSDDKGLYKAITGAIKYIFHSVFLIPSGDDPEKDEEKEVPTEKFNIEDKPIRAKDKTKEVTSKPEKDIHEKIAEEELGGKLLSEPEPQVDAKELEANINKFLDIVAGSSLEKGAKQLVASKDIKELKYNWLLLSAKEKKGLEKLKELLKQKLS